jgi:hypothetical protein
MRLRNNSSAATVNECVWVDHARLERLTDADHARSRAFPPQAVFGPAFMPGWKSKAKRECQPRSRGSCLGSIGDQEPHECG